MLCGAIHWCNFITTFQDLDKMNEILKYECWVLWLVFCGLCPGEKSPRGMGSPSAPLQVIECL